MRQTYSFAHAKHVVCHRPTARALLTNNDEASAVCQVTSEPAPHKYMRILALEVYASERWTMNMMNIQVACHSQRQSGFKSMGWGR